MRQDNRDPELAHLPRLFFISVGIFTIGSWWIWIDTKQNCDAFFFGELFMLGREAEHVLRVWRGSTRHHEGYHGCLRARTHMAEHTVQTLAESAANFALIHETCMRNGWEEARTRSSYSTTFDDKRAMKASDPIPERKVMDEIRKAALLARHILTLEGFQPDDFSDLLKIVLNADSHIGRSVRPVHGFLFTQTFFIQKQCKNMPKSWHNSLQNMPTTFQTHAETILTTC